MKFVFYSILFLRFPLKTFRFFSIFHCKLRTIFCTDKKSMNRIIIARQSLTSKYKDVKRPSGGQLKMTAIMKLVFFSSARSSAILK